MTQQEGARNTSIRREIAIGATWMLAFKLTERLLSLVSTVILARMLLPADFGIVAMAMSLATILELLTLFSFDIALIQRREVKREHLDTAWTFNIVFSVLVFVLMIGLAEAAADFYREPSIKAVIYVLAAAWLIQGFENIGIVDFRREMQFEKEYRFQAIKKLAGVLVTVPLAIALRSYWALVIGIVASRGISVLLSYQMHSFRPRLSLAGTRDLFGFSGWLLLNNILSFFNQRASDFVVGRLAGAQALGLYNISFEISNMPTTEIAAPINRAMLPGYTKIARENGQLGQTYLETVGAMAMFTLPAGLGIAAIADPLVRVLLGANWIDAIPLIQILGICGAVASIGNNTGSALIALGAPTAVTVLWIVRLTVLLPALVVATQEWGITGAAWAVFAISVIITPVNFAVILPRLRIPVRQILAQLWRPLTASASMYYLVAETIGQLNTLGFHFAFVQLVIAMLVGAIAYAAIIALLWLLVGCPVGTESMVRDLVRSWLLRRRRVGPS